LLFTIGKGKNNMKNDDSCYTITNLGRYERVHQNIKEGMGAIEALSAAAKKPPAR
jgi:hypothetical protein